MVKLSSFSGRKRVLCFSRRPILRSGFRKIGGKGDGVAMSFERTTLLLTTSTKTATVSSPSALGDSPGVVPIRPLEVLDEATARQIALYIALGSDLPPEGIESGLYDATRTLVTADPVNGKFFKWRSDVPLGQNLFTEADYAEMYAACKPQLEVIDDAEVPLEDAERMKLWTFRKVIERYYDWCDASDSCQENLAAAVMQEPRRNIRGKCQEVGERWLSVIELLQSNPQRYLDPVLKLGPKSQEKFLETAVFCRLPDHGEKPESAILDALEQLTGKANRTAKRYFHDLKIKLAP